MGRRAPGRPGPRYRKFYRYLQRRGALLNPTAHVVAFDSDLASLAALKRLCRHASGTRLRVVWGFLADDASSTDTLSSAVAATTAALARSGVDDEIGTTRYVCLTDAKAKTIVKRRLDDLIPSEVLATRPLLVKCDVEGAELVVLRGAAELLGRSAPVLALSVHPSALPDYGHSRDQVATFLDATGYGIRILAIDHEEHWWCERRV